MVNILYGVNGEGSGHSSRAREVIAHLEAQGHRVHVASFDRGLRNLKDDFDVTEIDGGGAQLVLEATFEIEGAAKPACVAELVFRYYF